MSNKLGGRIGLVMLAGLLVCGCRSSDARSMETLKAVMQPAMEKPTVGGPHRDLTVQRRQEKILTGVLRSFRDTGVELAAAWEPREGLWLLGKSLAGRSVLVEVTPIVPGRFVVRVTVEGADQVTRTLLEKLAVEISRRLG
ncbi:MAG: hypothetical protein ACM3VT_15500 [Solirubrobacterales bacterium]